MAEIVQTDVRVRDAQLHLRSVAGTGPEILIVHGWPESSVAWVPILERAAADGATVHAVDLPGIGGSTRGSTNATKHDLAQLLAELAHELGWQHPRLVGHDIGGMVAYAALRAAPIFERVAICNTVIPGVPPWNNVYGNPHIFHFHFHAVPGLPEQLVTGRERAYFDWFLDLLSDDPARISDEYRDHFAAAYATSEALTTGFDWYRALPDDAEHNAANTSPIDTPVLYLRGDADPVDVAEYLDGFTTAGLRDVQSTVIPHSGHSASLESPDALWQAIATFAR
ncbi:alpha/beta fold hydrolase [Kribbella italica]|uniref:Pimeloyl-ACP methyl ester carboxylesterase n=1 Tax=Kribbella italica TaxID=1540520 RepID=A0A7W9J576_9ACTN|nr:alpha/beta hydrolase [Kribbella italica]MBB5835851.1 pimeloyl-ACP methyl ester carboxylesterase [Kribbella italica]